MSIILFGIPQILERRAESHRTHQYLRETRQAIQLRKIQRMRRATHSQAYKRYMDEQHTSALKEFNKQATMKSAACMLAINLLAVLLVVLITILTK